MSVLPILSARVVLQKLLRAGFVIVSQKGSHVKLWHPTTNMRTGVPLHPGDLGRGLIRTIIKQAGLTVEQFLEL